MKLTPGPMVIPLWINGHPYLTVTRKFFDIAPGAASEVLRRVPLCGEEEVVAALTAAAAAQTDWAARMVGERREHLLALADALEAYADHFANLLCEEAGLPEADAIAEVDATLEALRAGQVGDGGVATLSADDERPLSSLAARAAPVLLAGGVVVCKSALRAPGAAFALCELSARAGWPGGVLNLVHGDVAVTAAFAAVASDRRNVGGGPQGEEQ